ncbi:hypothetical protein CYMTET_39954 [Cymbomonas tetramitiformis]|uniref:RRM domain-containing protein n=1 Tax=Cymbomonas tetramitiformis TaxID=36881 RepID=A0AAE0CB46_9CHLO|nr:hypothetical protein CYMTET_39954 [Cymbomonas tetramitiformis]
MAEALDKTLDEIIADRSKTKGGGKGRGKGRGKVTNARGAGKGGRGASKARAAPVVRAKISKSVQAAPTARRQRAVQMVVDDDDAWEHDLYENARQPVRIRTGALETGTKLIVNNLDFNVSNEDIKELFEELGDVKRANVNFDRSGRSMGTAEVVYARRADAMNAMKRYNGVRLDGKAMDIEMATSGGSAPSAVRNVVMRTSTAQASSFAGGRGSGGRGGGKGGRNGGKGGKGGRGKGGRKGGKGGASKSVEQMDDDLDSYMKG